MEEALARKLILIQAPAGFGKTICALSCRAVLETGGHAVAWLNVDRLDGAPARFLRHVVEALRGAAPDLIDDHEAAFEQSAPSLIETVCVDLVNAIASAGRDLCLVVEDLHLVDDGPTLAVLRFLIEHSPPNMHFLLTSRACLKLPLSRLRVSDELLLIGTDDLRLDEAEADAFLRQMWQMDLAASDIHALWRDTEGWAAALQLAALSLRGRSTATSSEYAVPRSAIGKALGTAMSAVGDYLAENVLDGLDSDILDFLLRTSILDRLSADLCDAVWGRPGSQVMLEELVRQDLFTRPLDDSGDWFGYHHLFAAHLRRRLRRDRSAEQRGLHLAASDWFATAGDVEAAVMHAKAAGDLDRAVALVEEQAIRFVIKGRLGTLIGLADLLPPARIRTRPELLRSLASACCATRRIEQAQLFLHDLSAALETSPNLPDLEKMSADARIIQAACDAYRDRTDHLKSTLTPFLADPSRFSAGVIAAASNIMAFVLLVEGRYRALIDMLERNFVFHRAMPGAFTKVYGLCYVGLAERGCGRMMQSRAALERALDLAVTEAGRHSFGARMVSGILALVAYEGGDLERAADLIAESRKLGSEGGITDFSIVAYVAAIRVAFGRGDAGTAAMIVEEGLQVAGQLSSARFRAAMLAEKLRLCLACGDIKAAEAVFADHAPPDRDDAPGRWIAAVMELARARLLAARGDTEEALAILHGRFDRICQEEQQLAVFRLRLQIATTFAMAGNAAAAWEPLAEAVTFAAREGLVRDFVDEGPAMRILLERMAKRLPVSCDNVCLHRHLWAVLGCWPALQKSVSADVGIQSGAAVLELVGAGTAEPLKERELQLLAILARGVSNKVIARELGLEVNTIKWHLKAIFRKLGADGQTQAVLKARARGLLPPAA